MDRKRLDALRRGRLDPEARLDLHGMTAERAHSALVGFILASHSGGRRLVLVITGKGRAQDGTTWTAREGGVLQHAAPHWLTSPPLKAKVLAVARAHRRHGGDGALYVHLRKLR